MSEEILFETKGVYITTERLVFPDATLAVWHVVSTKIIERHPNPEELGGLTAGFCIAVIFGLVWMGWLPVWLAVVLGAVSLMLAISARTPKEYVLTIIMSNGSQHETITRTRIEAETIQEFVNEAMSRRGN